MDKNKKILIVDDEKVNVISLAHFLKHDFEIIVATNGTEAIAETEKHKPDMILLDIVMPDMTGYDVLIKLKDSSKTMNIPVIFITGLSNVEDEEKGLTLGAVDYITKPFNQKLVKARINTHLRMSDYVHTIEKLCMIDALTGLPNRRGFNTRIETEWGRSFREKKPIGLIMIDIDNFKHYNDTYGHPQGDALLQTIGSILSKTLHRSSDVAVRWGGEEFSIILPDTDTEGTFKIAEQTRINVMETVITHADNIKASVTISLGACSKIPREGETVTDLMEEVDKLLYKAKKSGKNRTCMS